MGAASSHITTRRSTRHLFLRNTLFVCALFGTCASAQNRGVPADTARILSLENAWNGAEVNHDVRSLALLIADTFVYTDSDGSFLDKSQWLAMIKSEIDQYEQLSNSGVTVLVYENAAVATGEYRERIQIKGKMVLRSGRFTDTWILRKGEWRCVASQATLISK